MDVRLILIGAILVFSVAGMANAIYFGLELKRYAERTRALDSTLAMFRFKRVVAHQMYAALAQIVLLATPPVIFLIGAMLDVLDASDIFFVIVPAIGILVIAAFFRGYEKMARTIPASDPEIEEQRDAIVRTWLRKPWPDW